MSQTFFSSFKFKHLMTFKKYSILRILQIEQLTKLKLTGSVLDIGGKDTPNNISNFIKLKVNYLDKFAKGENDLVIDLEKQFEGQTSKYQEFDNVLLMNVLEHIYNYKNCVETCYKLTKKSGNLIGSTPFFFRIHPSPNDYFRYTEDALNKILKNAGYKDIKIYPLAGGIFITLYSNIFLITNKIPLLNNILLTLFSTLDQFLMFFTKSYKKIMPIGYFFTAKK